MSHERGMPAARVALGTWILLVVVVVAVLGFQLVSANSAVGAAEGDTTRAVDWLGVPMFEVFARDGRQGADYFWGTPAAVVVVPLVVAVLVGLWSRARVRAGSASRAGA